MKRLLSVAILFYFLLIPSMLFAQELEGGGIVYSSEIGAMVSAPKGWIFDSKSGSAQGLLAVMYPSGSTWANANEMMYVNIVESRDDTLDLFIAGDIEHFKETSPGITVEKAAPISMLDGAVAEVRLFSGDKWGNLECIAYASKGKSVVIYVLSSRSKEGMMKYLDAFRSLVPQSNLMNVTINK